MVSTGENTVAVCDTQPIVVQGMESLLANCGDLRMVGGVTSLICGMELVRELRPAVLIVDKAFGLAAVLDWITSIARSHNGTSIVIWGISMAEAEALRMIKTGAQGVIHKTASLQSILTCLRAVAAGSTWMEQALLREGEGSRLRSYALTPREQQIVELVEQGLKNKDIADNLGIRPGTVKIHLKHIFEKTGIRGRYGLALSGLREKGLLSYPTV